MNDVAWEIAHSVDTHCRPAFAWTYMTNVTNWDDPPAKFELDGEFVAGSRGTTRMPGQEPLHWHVPQVIPMESYTMEMPLEGAAIRVTWRFDGLGEDAGTRLTQRIVLSGENAAAYVEQVQTAFGANLAAGMNRIAAAIEMAEAGTRDAIGEAGF
jgi:polyketide cyclase/dehydrase/lipid transport protein